MSTSAQPARFENQACVITGATSGIGLATARRFRDHGARLAIMARRADRLHEVAAGLGPTTVASPGTWRARRTSRP